MTGNNPIHTFFNLGYVEGLYIEEMEMDEVAKIIKSGDVEKFRNWVKQQEEDIIFIENPEGSKSLLHCAVACSDSQKAKEMMTAILQYGIDINHLDKGGHTPLTDLLQQTKGQKKKLFSSNEDFKSLEEKIKFLIAHGATYSGEEYSKEQLKLIGECDKFKQDLQKQLKKELSTHIESNKKQSSIIEAIEIDGSCANIRLNSDGTELKISEFLQSNFCKNNGISSFSTFHNDEKGGLYGLLSSDGVRHYTVADGSYNMTLNWYVKGEKHTITINIDKDGVAWEKVHGITDEILQANKDVRINGLSLFGAIQQGRGRQINTERGESVGESQSAENSLTWGNVSDARSNNGTRASTYSNQLANSQNSLNSNQGRGRQINAERGESVGGSQPFGHSLTWGNVSDAGSNNEGSTSQSIYGSNNWDAESTISYNSDVTAEDLEELEFDISKIEDNFKRDLPTVKEFDSDGNAIGSTIRRTNKRKRHSSLTDQGSFSIKRIKLSSDNDGNTDQKYNFKLNDSNKLSNEQKDTRDIGQEAHPDKNMPSNPTAEIENNMSGNAINEELWNRFNQNGFGLNTTPEDTVEGQDWNKGSNQDSGYSSPAFKRTSEQSDNQVDPEKLNDKLNDLPSSNKQVETRDVGDNKDLQKLLEEILEKRDSLRKTKEGEKYLGEKSSQEVYKEPQHGKNENKKQPTYNCDRKRIGLANQLMRDAEEAEQTWREERLHGGIKDENESRVSSEESKGFNPKYASTPIKSSVVEKPNLQALLEEIRNPKNSLIRTEEGEKSSQEVYKEPQHGKNESKKQPTYNFDTTRVSLANQLMRNAEEERLHGGIKDENESRVSSEESKGFNPKYASTPIKSSVVEKPNLQALLEEIRNPKNSLIRTEEGEKSSQEVYKEPQHGKNESKKQPTYDFDKNRVGLTSEQQDTVNEFAKALANHTNKQGTPYVGTHTEKLEKASKKQKATVSR